MNQTALKPMLKESIDRFLAEFQNGTTDFTNFTSIFSRLLQNLPDPQLEVVWFYSALTFHSTKFTASYSSDQVLTIKDLLQLLVSCSVSCSAVKKIAMLAPVVYELYQLVLFRKNLNKEIESLLEGIISYISICCGKEVDEEDDKLVRLSYCFGDVVRVWLVDRNGDGCETGEDLRVFLPVVSDKIRKGVREGCGVGYLAGVVMNEAFLLRLCLKFGSGMSKAELEKWLRNWAVQTMCGFRNFSFFDTLLRMLLEPVLPLTSLLTSDNEVFLREVLYDAVTTLEYSFPSSHKEIQFPGELLKDLVITWLFVVDNAIQYIRENGDQTKAVAYISAFSDSCLPSQLIKWVTNQTPMGGKVSEPIVSTPLALIKWLLLVEDQGIRVFDCDISKIHAKTVICKSRVEYELPVTKPNGKFLTQNHLFCADNLGRGEDKIDGDLEMVDSEDTASMAAPDFMKLATNGTRKRKEGGKDEEAMQVKFNKYQLHENPLRAKFLPVGIDDGLSSGSEVDNPVSDEDMEYMEQ